jgi:hypothetical protein
MTTDMTQQDLRPYFLWDEDVSIAELREVLSGPPGFLRDRLFGKMLREARDIDVWHFVTPHQVAREYMGLKRRIGRRFPFWQFLINGWIEDKLINV